MEYKLFQNNLEDAHKISKYLVIACISQLLVIFVLAFLSIALSHRQMAVLVPMNLNAPMSISNNAVSTQYLDESAISFINLRLNFDPDTVDKNHQIILKFVSSDSYSNIKNALDTEAALVKSQGISSSFYINKVMVNQKTLTVMISGILNRSVVNKPLKAVKATFLISFDNDNGLLTLKNFGEVKQS